jgi:hypothetical protein
MKYFFSILAIVTTLGGIFYSQSQYLDDAKINDRSVNDLTNEREKERLELQSRIPTLGFGNLAADWLFLNFIQYFGDDEARKKTGYPLVPSYFAMIVNKDPRFVPAFLVLSSANSIYAGAPDTTVKLLDQALKSIEEQSVTEQIAARAQYLWIYKGVDEMLFLGDFKAAQHSFLMAKKLAETAKEDITAQRMQEVVQFLKTNPDRTKTKIAGWSFILSNAGDKKTQDYAVEQLRRLGVDVNPPNSPLSSD